MLITIAAALASSHDRGSADCALALMRATSASGRRAAGPQARHTARRRRSAASHAALAAGNAGPDVRPSAAPAFNRRSTAATSWLLASDALIVSSASWGGAGRACRSGAEDLGWANRGVEWALKAEKVMHLHMFACRGQAVAGLVRGAVCAKITAGRFRAQLADCRAAPRAGLPRP